MENICRRYNLVEINIIKEVNKMCLFSFMSNTLQIVAACKKFYEKITMTMSF